MITDDKDEIGAVEHYEDTEPSTDTEETELNGQQGYDSQPTDESIAPMVWKAIKVPFLALCISACVLFACLVFILYYSGDLKRVLSKDFELKYGEVSYVGEVTGYETATFGLNVKDPDGNKHFTDATNIYYTNRREFFEDVKGNMVLYKVTYPDGKGEKYILYVHKAQD